MAEFYTLSNLQDKYTDVCEEHCTDIPDGAFQAYLIFSETTSYTYFEIQLIYHLLQNASL